MRLLAISVIAVLVLVGTAKDEVLREGLVAERDRISALVKKGNVQTVVGT